MAFFSIRRTEQSVIAVAKPNRRAWPAREPSPKNSPQQHFDIIVSLPKGRGNIRKLQLSKLPFRSCCEKFNPLTDQVRGFLK
jgi:hypothetical protein